ncbi:hypothetical protein V8C42DRAFT_329591 [Trichoderma barbatum]
MASPQLMSSATEIHDTDHPSPPLSAVPRRVQELRDPKNKSRKRPKARPKETAPKDRHRSLNRRWREQVISNLDDGESFSNHLAILKILRRIPDLRDHVPQLVSNNPVARTYVVKYPRRDLVPFENEARFMHLSYRKIQSIKSQLFRSVKAMYMNGVRYNIYPQHLFLYGPINWNLTRLLFLGAVTDSDLLDIGQLDWTQQRGRVCAQIDRVFAPLEIWTFQEEAASLAEHAKEEMDLATSTINDKNAIIDAAKADLTEAQAIVAEAYQAMRDARAAIDGIKAISKNIFTSVINPHCIWEDAHLGKEHVETSRKKMDALNSRANTLIQKYGNPKPYNEVDAGDAISHPETTPEDNMEMKNSIPFIDATATDISITQKGVSANQTNLTEADSFGT